MHREQLPSGDELDVGDVVGGVWRLNVEQEPALAEDLGDVDDPGGLLVARQEAIGGQRQPVGVMTRDRRERTGLDRVAPNSGQMVRGNCRNAWILLEQDLPAARTATVSCSGL